MPLQLKSADAGRGMRWLVDAFRLFARKPLAFTLLLLVFFFLAALVAALLPLVGSLLQLMTLPLLSLGFMVASQSALLGGPVHPGQFVEPLRADPARRRSLLLLCLLYGVLALAVLQLSAWVSDDAMMRLQQLMAEGEKARPRIDALLAEPGVSAGAMLLLGLGTLLSIPFWHAPALVHWGGQGVGQALFSSTLAVWRNKAAFLGYFLGWTLLVLAFG
ncbi:MAG: BPSS1780 family membrane protein, partial [Pseudomonadota bacterium]